jgi:capsular polysaccharide biosynthesis protein
MATRFNNENYMNETIDMRRFFLCLKTKIWMIVLCTFVCALIGPVIYKAYYSITDGQDRYQRSCDFYITFNEADHPNGMDYYNAYTWGQFLLDDKMIEHVMDFGGSYTEDEIKASVTSRMMSDYRVLTVIVSGTDTRKIEAIYEAYKFAMPQFAGDVDEITSIRVWSEDDLIKINDHTHTFNAAILGAILGLFVSTVAWSLYYCMDDRIYTQSDWCRRFKNVAFLGYDCDIFEKESKEETDINNDEILVLKWGEHATAAEYLINEKKNSNIQVKGIKLVECDEAFLRKYYGRSKS